MEQFSFKAFLSHRYKSPEVNLYFFNIFKEVAQVQFEIDEGVYSTNVTRLEKMIFDSNAFIGIYPFPGSHEQAYLLKELKNQSKYFSLELDLAIRSNKPSIIFYDQRYRNLLCPPEGMFFQPFDMNEVVGAGGYPSKEKHKNEFSYFVGAVKNKMKYDASLRGNEKSLVPIILSEMNFNEKLIEDLKAVLLQNNFENVVIIKQPISLNNEFFKVLDKTIFAIIDHSGNVANSGIPAFIHGRFIPMIRIKRINSLSVEPELNLNIFLYGGVEVGYNKDLIQWSNNDSLIEAVKSKVKLIIAKVKRINTYNEALEYFTSASLRKEIVFVSYSGIDVEIAYEIIQELRNYFQTVFDYRDGKSIIAGQPWIDEIFNKLSKSAIGISLLSASYLESGNCMHEAEQLVANKDYKKTQLVPIKLYDENLKLPEFLESLQYLRKFQFSSIKELVKKINELTINK